MASVPATNPLSYNLYIQQIGIMAVADTAETTGVWEFVDAPLQGIVNQMLNYAERRIQRDCDLLNAKSYNTYTLNAGSNLLQIPINDFLMLETLEVTQNSGTTIVNSTPLTPVSKEFIQNCYAGAASGSAPRFFATIGDSFGNGADTNINVLLGPTPNYAYSVRAFGVICLPSLAKYASDGPADTSFTYISQFFPDLLILASMIYISAFQRNWSSTSDDPAMAMSYEKQYQALRLGAISEENRRKFNESAWSSMSTPVSATPTRG
jgi:hypothetical protein